MKYTDAAGIERQSFEGQNQNIIQKFVNREVFLDVTNFVEEIIRLNEEPWEEFPEFYEGEFPPLDLPELGKRFGGGTADDLANFTTEIEEQRDQFIEEIGEQEEPNLAKIPKEHVAKIIAYKKALQILDAHRDNGNTREIYCYYSVSEHLAHKLKQKGCAVCEYGIHYIYGREAFGQSITVDSVTNSICIDEEILEGQKYSWVDKNGNVM